MTHISWKWLEASPFYNDRQLRNSWRIYSNYESEFCSNLHFLSQTALKHPKTFGTFSHQPCIKCQFIKLSIMVFNVGNRERWIYILYAFTFAAESHASSGGVHPPNWREFPEKPRFQSEHKSRALSHAEPSKFDCKTARVFNHFNHTRCQIEHGRKFSGDFYFV